MPHKITAECISCGACIPECPFEAISEGEETYIIDPEKCNDCKPCGCDPKCVEVCPVEAIEPVEGD